MSAGAGSGPLLAPETLAGLMDDDRLLILDVRLAADGGRASYEAGHVPGARFSDYAADGWRAKVGGAPGLLPSADHLARLLGGLGIEPRQIVVIVPAGTGANDLAASARVYWTLKTVGHDAVSILDGGFAGWVSDPARPVETGWRAPAPVAPYPVKLRMNWRATADDCTERLKHGDSAFVDARSASYFEGREKAPEALRAGHIPGAVSRDYAALFDPARRGLRALAELEALFAGVPPGRIISYCNTGHTAALNWFVLSELLGRADVRLYDGSMTDWTQDESRPVAP